MTTLALHAIRNKKETTITTLSNIFNMPNPRFKLGRRLCRIASSLCCCTGGETGDRTAGREVSNAQQASKQRYEGAQETLTDITTFLSQRENDDGNTGEGGPLYHERCPSLSEWNCYELTDPTLDDLDHGNRDGDCDGDMTHCDFDSCDETLITGDRHSRSPESVDLVCKEDLLPEPQSPEIAFIDEDSERTLAGIDQEETATAAAGSSDISTQTSSEVNRDDGDVKTDNDDGEQEEMKTENELQEEAAAHGSEKEVTEFVYEEHLLPEPQQTEHVIMNKDNKGSHSQLTTVSNEQDEEFRIALKDYINGILQRAVIKVREEEMATAVTESSDLMSQTSSEVNGATDDGQKDDEEKKVETKIEIQRKTVSQSEETNENIVAAEESNQELTGDVSTNDGIDRTAVREYISGILGRAMIRYQMDTALTEDAETKSLESSDHSPAQLEPSNDDCLPENQQTTEEQREKNEEEEEEEEGEKDEKEEELTGRSPEDLDTLQILTAALDEPETTEHSQSQVSEERETVTDSVTQFDQDARDASILQQILNNGEYNISDEDQRALESVVTSLSTGVYQDTSSSHSQPSHSSILSTEECQLLLSISQRESLSSEERHAIQRMVQSLSNN